MLEFRSSDVQVRVVAPDTAAATELLTADCLRFVGTLCSAFEDRRQDLLQARRIYAQRLETDEEIPVLKEDTRDWQCAPIPNDLTDRRVEITGPVDRKMVLNGLNSGAKVYMADFEDSTSPTWTNLIQGQVNLRDAVAGTIALQTAKKKYSLNETTATLFVRPRGWHLDEAHVMVNGRVASGAIFDFAVYLFHNAHALLQKGTRPYYYLAKLENHREARLWNDVILAAQSYLGLPVGTVRATVLLETITAAFEMEEILYELRDHSVGLNCGRWDYLFSFIKKFKYTTPDRQHLTMKIPLMQAYVERLVHICHKRGTFAMGGMSASIPVKNDPAKNAQAMEQVRLDKLREVQAGHDGTWVAHPALVSVAMQVFDQHLKTPNQVYRQTKCRVMPADLLQLPASAPAVTEADLVKGVGIVLAYTEAWLRGVGCIPLHGSMEDAATAEISRAQIWQWRRQGLVIEGQPLTAERVAQVVAQQSGGLAGRLVTQMLNADELDDFLTTVCYPYIVTSHLDSGKLSRL